MRGIKVLLLILCIVLINPAIAKKTVQKRSKTKHVATHQAPITITTTDDIAGFDRYPRDIKKLIAEALALSDQHLAYKFGSTDPKNNGMDCSGTISYLLKSLEVRDVPRQADEIYQWAWKYGEFSAVNSHNFGTFEFAKLKPGDLLFWSGTYPVKRDPAITHVMLYLGRDKHNRPLMFGANSGGTYRGKTQNGVSVFEFNMPRVNSKVRFLGYACIPHLTCDS
jgi:cell wall-associated NlpC family hydrolase